MALGCTIVKDLLFGEKAWAALLAEITRPVMPFFGLPGVSVGKCSWLDPDAIVGCTERGRQIVKDMQEAAEAAGGE